MTAVQMMTGQGGWPLNVFLTPEGKPFFGGTYFPPEDRHGRAGLPRILGAVREAWTSRREEIERSAGGMAERIAETASAESPSKGAAIGDAEAALAAADLAARFDHAWGGFGGAPKFPPHGAIALLLREHRRTGERVPLSMATSTLDRMAMGGMYDQFGGGFARYSVDERWLVPHFEKMLYDQALLVPVYVDAWLLTGAPLYRDVVLETLDFVRRELTDPGGGFWSSLDADSGGHEGSFYVWTPAEIDAVLGAGEGAALAATYGITPEGNFEGKSIAHLSDTKERARLASAREKLLRARASRVRPATDDKVLAAWNGLAITGLLAAWRATGHDPALALALRVAAFLRDCMIASGTVTTVRRVHHEGVTKELEGTLDDYAFCADAFLELAEATGDRAWWDLGARLVATIRTRFVEDKDGVAVFYLSPPGDALLVHRPESHHDSAIPAGAAIAVRALLRLGLVAGDESALALAERYLAQRLTGTTGVNAWATSALVGALDLYLHAKVCVVTAGTGRDELVTSARRVYAPTLCIAGAWAQPSILEAKNPAADRARAFVCSGPTCSPPTDESAELVAILADHSPAAR